MFKRILSGFRGTAALPQDDDLPEELLALPRSAVMLLPKQRYMSWLKSWDKDVTLNLEQARQNAIVYLIPLCETLAEAREYVEQNHQAFFEHELSTWTADRRVWPQDRSLAVFRQWFNVEFRDMVIDWVNQAPKA